MDTWNVRRRDILLWLVQIPWHVQRTDRAACQRLSGRSGATAARGQAAWHHAAMLGFVGQGPCWASLSACRLCRLRAASQRGCRRQAAECCCWDCLWQQLAAGAGRRCAWSSVAPGCWPWADHQGQKCRDVWELLADAQLALPAFCSQCYSKRCSVKQILRLKLCTIFSR